MQRKIAKRVVLLLGIAAIAACVSGQVAVRTSNIEDKYLQGPKMIDAGELTNGSIVIMGPLHRQLGTYVSVEGDYTGRALNPGGTDFIVEKILGSELKGRIWISLEDSQSPIRLVEHHRYQLRGYEMCLYDPMMPTDPELVPGNPQNPPLNQPGAPTFRTYFYVTKAEDLGPVKPEAASAK